MTIYFFDTCLYYVLLLYMALGMHTLRTNSGVIHVYVLSNYVVWELWMCPVVVVYNYWHNVHMILYYYYDCNEWLCMYIITTVWYRMCQSHTVLYMYMHLREPLWMYAPYVLCTLLLVVVIVWTLYSLELFPDSRMVWHTALTFLSRLQYMMEMSVLFLFTYPL